MHRYVAIDERDPFASLEKTGMRQRCGCTYGISTLSMT